MSKPTGDDRPHYGNENGTMALGTDDSPPVVAIACEVLPTPFSSPCRTRARAQAQSLREVHLATERLVARVRGYLAKERIPCHPKQPVVVLAEGSVEPSKGPVGIVARSVDQSDPKAFFAGERLLSNCELPIRIAATSQRVQRKGAPSVPIPEVRFLLHLPECCGRLASNEQHRTQQIVDLVENRRGWSRVQILTLLLA